MDLLLLIDHEFVKSNIDAKEKGSLFWDGVMSNENLGSQKMINRQKFKFFDQFDISLYHEHFKRFAHAGSKLKLQGIE